jgi:hypothetical protein
MYKMSMCVLALKYVRDVCICIGFEICMICLCVYWLWNMYKMSMCVLALRYVWYVYVCIGFEICMRCLCVHTYFKSNTHVDISYILQSQYTHRHLIHISKPIHTYTSCTYFKANTHIDISYIFQIQYTHRDLIHISKPIHT